MPTASISPPRIAKFRTREPRPRHSGPGDRRALRGRFGGPLEGTYVRIEYAQDIDGFWLKPHTDIGVKMFTMLIYMSDDPRHADLGTDIYADENTHVAGARL